jgi:protein-S-isoprenylcysteine O-methyltransferase Ste14
MIYEFHINGLVIDMSIIPEFEIGLWNAWILMIWVIILPMISSITIKEKGVSKKLRTSVPMKHEKSLNIISMTAVIFGFIYSIFLPLKFNTLWFYLGLILFIIGFFLDISVLYTIRNSKLDKPFTKGPYRYSRHPIYLSLIFVITSIIITTFSWIFIIIAIILIMHQILAMPAEEQYCLKRYGKEYKDYMNRTPRWFGFPKTK